LALTKTNKEKKMRYAELKKIIINEQKDKENESYVAHFGDCYIKQRYVAGNYQSNFLSDKDANSITDKQFDKLEKEGLIERDFIDWIVVK
jgi:hypothetical protein